MWLRQPGDQAGFVFFIDARPAGRVHRLRARGGFTLLKVGEPVPLFTDRLPRVDLPLGFVRRLFVGTCQPGQPRPQTVVRRAGGHRAGPALPLRRAAGPRPDRHLTVAGGGEAGLRVTTGARAVAGLRHRAGPGAAGTATGLLQQVVPGAHPLEQGPGSGETLVVRLRPVHRHFSSLHWVRVVLTDGVAGVGRRKGSSRLSRNV